MDYTQAAETLLKRDVILGGFSLLISIGVLLVLAANAKDAWKKLFGRKKASNVLEQHIAESEDRFKRGEKHISENHDHIADLREGQRVCCLSLIALLGHELHNGNKDEMESALRELNSYLINRK